MQRLSECATAWLSVTDLVNERWSERMAVLPTAPSKASDAATGELPRPALPSAPELLCSDAISVRAEQIAEPGFNAASYVMETALDHTERYCRDRGVSIPGFRSVEVLRLAHPANGALSFLFLMETGLPA
jgi:hypothetical protein